MRGDFPPPRIGIATAESLILPPNVLSPNAFAICSGGRPTSESAPFRVTQEPAAISQEIGGPWIDTRHGELIDVAGQQGLNQVRRS
jgi:hypothetical protein